MEICELSEINRAPKLENEFLEELGNNVSQSVHNGFQEMQGCSGILSQWLENGMTEPVSEITDFANKLV